MSFESQTCPLYMVANKAMKPSGFEWNCCIGLEALSHSLCCSYIIAKEMENIQAICYRKTIDCWAKMPLEWFHSTRAGVTQSSWYSKSLPASMKTSRKTDFPEWGPLDGWSGGSVVLRLSLQHVAVLVLQPGWGLQECDTGDCIHHDCHRLWLGRCLAHRSSREVLCQPQPGLPKAAAGIWEIWSAPGEWSLGNFSDADSHPGPCLALWVLRCLELKGPQKLSGPRFPPPSLRVFLRVCAPVPQLCRCAAPGSPYQRVALPLGVVTISWFGLLSSCFSFSLWLHLRL